MASKPSGLRQPNAIKASNTNLAAPSGASAGPETPAATPAKPPGGSAIPMSRLPSSNSIRRKIATPLGMQTPGSKGDSTMAADNDNFIIGDVVYVNGDPTKRGRITFIREVGFAKGEFAGIALDLPVGNHDGMVQGKRYFQCAPSHGLFTKLNRLTRDVSPEPPLPFTPGPVAMNSPSYPVLSPTVPRHIPQMSRTASAEERTPSPSPSRSIVGPSSSLVIGERVICASSTGGTKIGILRYLGPTEFSNGEWAGVELLTPMGKNNGTVGGKSYFSCEDKYGLFVPASKVVSSPINKTPRRHGSRESLMSMSSMASSAASKSIRRSLPRDSQCLPTCNLRAVLTEKESHIEKILKERELDRIDYENLSRQFEEKLSEVKKLQAECAGYQQQLQVSVSDGETVTNLQNALEEEKRKVEDLQYTLDEEKIMKADLQTQLDALSSKSSEESKKSLEISRVESEQLSGEIEMLKAQTSAYVLEKKTPETKLVEAYSKIESFEKIVQDLTAKATALMEELDSEKLDHANLVTTHQNQVATLTNSATDPTETTNKVNQELSDKKRLVEEHKGRLQKLQNEYTNVENQRKVLEGEVVDLISTKANSSEDNEVLTTKIVSLSAEIDDLRAKLDSSDEDKACLRRINAEYKSRIAQHEQIVSALKSELEQNKQKLADDKGEVEKKLQELVSKAENEKQKLEERANAKEAEISALQVQITAMKEEVSSQTRASVELTQEIERLKSSGTDAFTKINDFELLLKTAQADNVAIKAASDKAQSELNEQNTKLSKEISEMSSQLAASTEESRVVKAELNSMKTVLAQSKVTVDEKETKINQLESEIAKMKKSMEDDSAALDKLKQDLDGKLDSLKKDKQRLQEKVSTYQQDSGQFKEIEQALSAEVFNLRSKLETTSKTISELEKKVEEKNVIIETDKTAKQDVGNPESHIQFLNTVIADLQNRVAAAGTTNTYQSLRPYCDICEKFDSHDTEDCPTQEPEHNTHHGATRGEPRPYCNVCEIFGHNTGECDDQETF